MIENTERVYINDVNSERPVYHFIGHPANPGHTICGRILSWSVGSTLILRERASKFADICNSCGRAELGE